MEVCVDMRFVQATIVASVSWVHEVWRRLKVLSFLYIDSITTDSEGGIIAATLLQEHVCLHQIKCTCL